MIFLKIIKSKKGCQVSFWRGFSSTSFLIVDNYSSLERLNYNLQVG